MYKLEFILTRETVGKVLKPGLDRTVWPGKPRTAHFCGSFSLKNYSMGKKQGPVWTTVEPHGFENCDQTASHGSLLPFESEPLKKKKKHRKTKEKETQLLGVHHVFRNSATAISRETQHVFMFLLLLLSSEYIMQLPLFRNSSLGQIRL